MGGAIFWKVHQGVNTHSCHAFEAYCYMKNWIYGENHNLTVVYNIFHIHIAFFNLSACIIIRNQLRCIPDTVSGERRQTIICIAVSFLMPFPEYEGQHARLLYNKRQSNGLKRLIAKLYQIFLIEFILVHRRFKKLAILRLRAEWNLLLVYHPWCFASIDH